MTMAVMEQTLSLGANLRGTLGTFRVWAPAAHRMQLVVNGRQHEMERDGEYFAAEVFAAAGERYAYRVDGGKSVPDPVSRFLPDGVHGRTEIVDPHAFDWADREWRGIPLRDAIIYELHVGTFTPEGTFDGAVSRLEYLKDTLGVTVIELMPVAAFPGTRNWGYDGVSPYAVQASYGGPDGLKRLVNAAHRAGLAVILDVVYNHLGNEGNYLDVFGPYFTDRHQTPWGRAINYAERGVREWAIENARYWLREYHLDGLRLDAVQTIFDDSPTHILREFADAVHDNGREAGRVTLAIAESDENDSRLIREYGLDAFWSDDFHHAVHGFTTGERAGYYQDFGRLEQIARALNEGYVFQGEHFAFWNAPRGTPASDVALPANVICIQNHDQVGNRAQGDRLTTLVKSSAARKAAAALLLLAPHTPLIFMGQEYDEARPFQFFTSYGDSALQKAVSEGRRNEFKDFDFSEVPDPESPETFDRSKLDWTQVSQENEMLDWYEALIRLRKEFVTASGRRCTAAAHQPGSITMKSGGLQVSVNFQRSDLPEVAGEQLLYAADENAAVAVHRLP